MMKDNFDNNSSSNLERSPSAESDLVALLVSLQSELINQAYLDPATADEVLAGLVTIWLAGSRYKLLQPGVDLFARLLNQGDYPASNQNRHETTDLGLSLTELLTRFQPASLPTLGRDESVWPLSPSVGLRLCQGLNRLHLVEEADLRAAGLFRAWLQLSHSSSTEASHPLLVRLTNDQYAGGIEADLGDQFEVGEETDGAALAERFTRLIALYAAINAAMLRPGSTEAPKAQPATIIDHPKLVTESVELLTDLPACTLAHFQARPGLSQSHRLAAQLALWESALAAYAVEQPSTFTDLPRWELR